MGMGVQERKLQSRLYASLITSKPLQTFFLHQTGIQPDWDECDVEDWEGLNKSKGKKDEIDFMLTYKNSRKSAATIGLEIKKPAGTLKEAQIAKYLEGMKIKKRGSWRLHKKSSRTGKFLIILTSDFDPPPSIVDVQKYSVFQKVLIWISWYDVINWMNKQPKDKTFDAVLQELAKVGIVPSNATIPIPSQYKTLKSRIDEMHKVLQSYKETKSAIDNQLANLEHEMKLLKYTSLNIPTRLALRLESTTIPKWHGKLFSKNLDKTDHKRKGVGVAFGYCHEKQNWFVHVESQNDPNPDEESKIRKLARTLDAPLNKKWVNSYVRSNNTKGGWRISTASRSPKSLAKFIDKVWIEYLEIISK